MSGMHVRMLPSLSDITLTPPLPNEQMHRLYWHCLPGLIVRQNRCVHSMRGSTYAENSTNHDRCSFISLRQKCLDNRCAPLLHDFASVKLVLDCFLLMVFSTVIMKGFCLFHIVFARNRNSERLYARYAYIEASPRVLQLNK